MRLIKLHRVLVVGGAALVASCGDADVPQQQSATNLTDAAPDDSAQPSIDAAPQADAQGVDAWLSWVVTTDAAQPGDADAAPDDAGGTVDADPADARGVDAWLSWA